MVLLIFFLVDLTVFMTLAAPSSFWFRFLALVLVAVAVLAGLVTGGVVVMLDTLLLASALVIRLLLACVSLIGGVS